MVALGGGGGGSEFLSGGVGMVVVNTMECKTPWSKTALAPKQFGCLTDEHRLW